MANPECPWFKFYVRDWLTDARVRAMTLEQRGAYLELLCLQWENGAIPYAVSDIAALLNVSVEHFKAALWPKLSGRFPRSGGRSSRRRNARLEREREYFARKQSAGKRGGAKSRPPKRLLRGASSKPEATLENREQMSEQEESSEEDSRRKWNAIAATNELPKTQKLSATRRKKLAKIVNENPDFWTELDAAIRDRGSWARQRRFPTFDQAVRPEIFQRLIEGNYCENSAGKTLRQSNILPTDGPATITVDGEEHVIPDSDKPF